MRRDGWRDRKCLRNESLQLSGEFKMEWLMPECLTEMRLCCPSLWLVDGAINYDSPPGLILKSRRSCYFVVLIKYKMRRRARHKRHQRRIKLDLDAMGSEAVEKWIYNGFFVFDDALKRIRYWHKLKNHFCRPKTGTWEIKRSTLLRRRETTKQKSNAAAFHALMHRPRDVFGAQEDDQDRHAIEATETRSNCTQ